MDLSFLSLLLSHTSGAYPFTIHIANGLAAGSADVLTLNESLALPTTVGQITESYGFAPMTLAAGTYYLILTSSFALPQLEWEQNQAGSSTLGTLGRLTSIMALNSAPDGKSFRPIAHKTIQAYAPPAGPWRSTWNSSSTRTHPPRGRSSGPGSAVDGGGRSGRRSAGHSR